MATNCRRLAKLFYALSATLLLLCLFNAPAAAQSESGSAAVEGVISAPDGKVIAGATLLVRNAETGYARTLTTNERGQFIASVMPIGLYLIEVKAGGFATTRRESVQLTVGQTETVDLALQVAGVNETVTVTSDSAAIDTEEGATGTTIGQRAVSELPIRGRNFTDFIQLTPGIVQDSDRKGLVIAGQRSINSNIALDGADFNDALQGNQRGGNDAVFFFPQTAIREFQVVRSGATAEVGRTGAGFVNAVTKSGTNDWHGEALYLNRNPRLTAPDAFENKGNNQQNQFGGSVGFGVDSISLYGNASNSLPAVAVPTVFPLPGEAFTAPSTARFGGPRQLQLGARFVF